MRKNQQKNRQRRKEINRQKAPVSRVEKKILNARSYIRRAAVFLIVFLLLTALSAGYTYINLNANCWKEAEITYQNHYYVPRTSSARGGSTGDYYIITDTHNRDWRINWELNGSEFTSDIKQGDSLTLRYHYWLVGRLAVTLESDNHVYRSFDEAVDDGKSNGRAGIVFTLFALALHILSLVCLVKKKAELKKLRTEHENAVKNYSEYLSNI